MWRLLENHKISEQEAVGMNTGSHWFYVFKELCLSFCPDNTFQDEWTMLSAFKEKITALKGDDGWHSLSTCNRTRVCKPSQCSAKGEMTRQGWPFSLAGDGMRRENYTRFLPMAAVYSRGKVCHFTMCFKRADPKLFSRKAAWLNY